MKSMQENEAIKIKAWIESEVKIRGLICTSHQLQSSLYIVINEILFHCNNVIEAVWRHQWWRHTRNYILLANLVKLQDYEWKQKYLPYLESNVFLFCVITL